LQTLLQQILLERDSSFIVSLKEHHLYQLKQLVE
jgi:hypothetical protein